MANERQFKIGAGAQEQFAKKEEVKQKLSEISFMIDSLFSIVQNEGVIIPESDFLESSQMLSDMGDAWEVIDETLYDVFKFALSNEVTPKNE